MSRAGPRVCCGRLPNGAPLRDLPDPRASSTRAFSSWTSRSESTTRPSTRSGPARGREMMSVPPLPSLTVSRSGRPRGRWAVVRARRRARADPLQQHGRLGAGHALTLMPSVPAGVGFGRISNSPSAGRLLGPGCGLARLASSRASWLRLSFCKTSGLDLAANEFPTCEDGCQLRLPRVSSGRDRSPDPSATALRAPALKRAVRRSRADLAPGAPAQRSPILK